MACEATAIAFGDLELSQCGQQPRRRPAFLVGTLGKTRSVLLDGGQTEIVEHHTGVSVRGSFSGRLRPRPTILVEPSGTVSHIDGDNDFISEGPISPLLHRQAGPRRSESRAQTARCCRRPHLHRPWINRHQPAPTRPRSGSCRDPHGRHTRCAKTRPPCTLGSGCPVHRRRAGHSWRQARAGIQRL